MSKKTWSEKETEQMREMYPAMSNAQLANFFGRTIVSVEVKASRMGLEKEEERKPGALGRKQWTAPGFTKMGPIMSTLTVSYEKGIKVTRATTVDDPRYTPQKPYVGEITGEMRFPKAMGRRKKSQSATQLPAEN